MEEEGEPTTFLTILASLILFLASLHLHISSVYQADSADSCFKTMCIQFALVFFFLQSSSQVSPPWSICLPRMYQVLIYLYYSLYICLVQAVCLLICDPSVISIIFTFPSYNITVLTISLSLCTHNRCLPYLLMETSHTRISPLLSHPKMTLPFT